MVFQCLVYLRIWRPVPEKRRSSVRSSIRFENPLRRRARQWERINRRKRYIRPAERSNTSARSRTTNEMSIFNRIKSHANQVKENFWARDGMNVTFRAEIMPGKSREERTYRIDKVLPNGRVVLQDFLGEHREGAFEPLNFLREKVLKDQNS